MRRANAISSFNARIRPPAQPAWSCRGLFVWTQRCTTASKNFDKTNVLAALNFTNLLDHRYFTGGQGFREIIYTGVPFTVIGSLKFEFH
jgi:hypothetical protein